MLKYSLIFGSILALEAVIIGIQKPPTGNAPVTTKNPLPIINPFVFSGPTKNEILLTPHICKNRCLKTQIKDQVSEPIGLGFASLEWGIVEGVFDAGESLVKGVWTLVTDPIGVTVNIVHAGRHPFVTAKQIAHQIKIYCTNDGNPNAESIGKCVGMFFFISNLKVIPLLSLE
jgi:hypothetical protein